MKNPPPTIERYVGLGSKHFLNIDLNRELADRIGSEIEYRPPNREAIQDSAEQEILSLINLTRIAPIFSANMIFETIRNRFEEKTYIDVQNLIQYAPGLELNEANYILTDEGYHAIDDLIKTLHLNH